jgi:hypothetical protein
MRFGTTRTTPAFGQAQIPLTEPVSLVFMDLRPQELNKVILGRLFILRSHLHFLTRNQMPLLHELSLPLSR